MTRGGLTTIEKSIINPGGGAPVHYTPRQIHAAAAAAVVGEKAFRDCLNSVVRDREKKAIKRRVRPPRNRC